MHICAIEMGNHVFRQRFDIYSALSHYMKQYRPNVNWNLILGTTNLSELSQNSWILIPLSAFEAKYGSFCFGSRYVKKVAIRYSQTILRQGSCVLLTYFHLTWDGLGPEVWWQELFCHLFSPAVLFLVKLIPQTHNGEWAFRPSGKVPWNANQNTRILKKMHFKIPYAKCLPLWQVTWKYSCGIRGPGDTKQQQKQKQKAS